MAQRVKIKRSSVTAKAETRSELFAESASEAAALLAAKAAQQEEAATNSEAVAADRS